MVHLALILATRDSGVADLVTRIAIASVGVWWFGWAIWTLRVLPEPPVNRAAGRLTVTSAVSMGFRELRNTFHELARFRVALVFLAAYILFNDGIQTALAIAGAFAADTIGISLAFNMATIVIIPVRCGAGRESLRVVCGEDFHQAGLDHSPCGLEPGPAFRRRIGASVA